MGYYYLMGVSIIPATWFQVTIIKWCVFVRKYVAIRERRVRQLLFRIEQQDALKLEMQTKCL
jgi:hypothetical protein